MSELDAIFRFRIGETVQHVATHGDRPAKFFVVERVLSECPGGAQRHYKCRAFGQAPTGESGIVQSLFTINEIELQAHE